MTEKILIALLGLELFGTPIAEELKAQIPKHEKKLFSLARHHDLAAALANALDKCGVKVGDEVAQALENERLLTLFRHENICFAQNEVCAALEEGQIDHIPLKGAVIRGLYPDPTERTSCDVDILVRPEDADRAVKLICEGCGYTFTARNYHDISLHSPGGVHVELHFELGEAIGEVGATYGRVWEYSSPAPERKHERRMTDAYLIFHNIAHAAYHFLFGGIGVRALTDLSLLKNRLDYDRDELASLLSESELETFANELFSMCDAWFFGGELTEVGGRMEKFVLRSGVYGTQDNKVAVAQGEKKGKIRYLLSRIFLPYESLKRLYPVLEKHKILMPVCQVRRWFRLLRGGAARRSAAEVKTTAKLDQARAAEVNRLMSDLKLK